MKVIQSSLFRALCAIIVGALLIQYREQTVTWITIAIGVLFFLSGVFSLLSYMSAKRSAEKMKGQYLYDAQGNQIIGMRPNFPIGTRAVNRCPASEIWGGRWSDTMTRLSLNALLKTDPESLFSAELTAFCGLRFCCFSGS